MPLTETVTIINNSGKIISTGKQLFGVFKDAKDAYQAKKAAIRSDREILKRSQTFDATRGGFNDFAPAPSPYQLPPHNLAGPAPAAYAYDDYVEYYDDGRSRASHRSHRTSRTTRTRRSHSQSSRTPRDVDYHPRSRPALTETNLRSHRSEVSSVTASRAPPPAAYHSPYAETAPRDLALSRPTLHHYPTEPSIADSATIRPGTVIHPGTVIYPGPQHHAPPPPGPGTLARSHTFDVAPRRAGSDPALAARKKKDIDMNLAYGNIPPDLATRHDLDPAYQGADKEHRAKGLVRHVEGLLDEAQCVGSSAGTIIKRLQTDPNAAAAVALSLAELSKLLGTMSPAFLGILKGGSPAVFALLASPQFLIAAGVTVGMTVVMFGGWKIVKKIRDERAQQAQAIDHAMAFEAIQAAPQHWPAEGSVTSTMLNGEAAEYYVAGGPPPQRRSGGAGYGPGGHGGGPGGPGGPRGPGSRNGGGSQGSFDEALVLEEELSTIESWRRGIASYGEDDSVDLELISPEAQKAMRKQRRDEERRSVADDVDDDARTERSARTHRTSKTAKTSKTTKTAKTSKTHHSSHTRRPDDAASDAGSHRSHRSSRSKRTERVETLAIEDAPAGGETLDPGLEYVLRPKKPSMLKTLFKKKDKERGGERPREKASAVVF